MSDDIIPSDLPLGEDEYEEISSDEVDRIVAQLENLAESVDSENVRLHLEEAINAIWYLVYDDSEDEGTLEEAA